jgi:hypothetical protein
VHLRHLRFFIPSLGLCVAGCISTATAPGAAQVRITQNAADVASCTAVGNVNPAQGQDPRNLTVGLGGNTLFATAKVFGQVASGVAYRCP